MEQSLVKQAACSHWSKGTYKEEAESAYQKQECVAITSMARKVSVRSFEAGAEWHAKQNLWRNFKDERPKPNSHILRKMIHLGYQACTRTIYYADFWDEDRPDKWEQENDRVVYEWQYIDK